MSIGLLPEERELIELTRDDLRYIEKDLLLIVTIISSAESAFSYEIC